MDPPDANDVLKILKAINFDPWVEDLFTDAFWAGTNDVYPHIGH